MGKRKKKKQTALDKGQPAFVEECDVIRRMQEQTQSFLENWSKSKRASFSE